MTEQVHIQQLAFARDYKAKGEFAKATKCYECLYQTYVDRFHQHYHYSRQLAIYNEHINPYLLIDGQEAPPFKGNWWEIEKVIYYPEIVNEYTLSLILSNNPNFKLEDNEAYKRMILYNTEYEIDYSYGKPKTVAIDPYPFNFQILQFNHVFKNDNWKGLALWEVELSQRNVLTPIVLRIPTSNFPLDLALTKPYYLSKYRTRDREFYSALETNYSKLQAYFIWEERKEPIEFERERLMEDEIADQNDSLIKEAGEDELRNMRLETDGFSDWNMD